VGQEDVAKKGEEMKRALILSAVIIALTVPALAAPADTAKPKPCPKGQVALTSTVTGDHYCGAMGIVPTNGMAQPVLIPEKPAKKTKP
jgi:hypothetical protein